jgi:hypothetical protein
MAMGRTWVGAIGIGCMAFVLGACGAGNGVSSEPPPPVNVMTSCLRSEGAVVKPLEAGDAGELIGAQTPDGDLIFIFNLSDPDLSARATQALEAIGRENSDYGAMRVFSVNHSSTLVGIVGIKKLNHGAVLPKSDRLARRCATGTHAEVGIPA